MAAQNTTPRPASLHDQALPQRLRLLPTTLTPPNVPASKLIILASDFPPAPPTHPAKYLTSHRTIYPTTPLLLIRTSRRAASSPSLPFRELAAFAVPVIRAACPTTYLLLGGPPGLLIHAFSGGSSAPPSLTSAPSWRHMPSHAVVFDSAPPRFAYGASARAGSRPAAAWFWRLLMRLAAAWLWVERTWCCGAGELARQAGSA